MKVFFLNDSSSNPNWGDRAAALALRAMITEAGAEIGAGLTESELSRQSFYGTPVEDTDRSEPSPVAVVARKITRRLTSRLGPVRSKALDTGAVPRSWHDYPAALDAWRSHPEAWAPLRADLEACDVVLVHGDGAIATPSRIVYSMLFVAYLAREELDKPVAWVNHTSDPSDDSLEGIVRGLYPMLDDLKYRETRSAERWRDLAPGRYVPDSAFRFEPAAREDFVRFAGRPHFLGIWPYHADFDPGRPYVCIGGSSLLYPLDTERQRSVAKVFEDLVRTVRDRVDAQVVLVASDRRDEAIFAPLASELHLPFLPVATPVQMAVDVLGNASAYVGGRWHAGIFALRGGTPIVPLTSKTFKMQALCDMTGALPYQAVDVFTLDDQLTHLRRDLFEVLDAGTALRAHLRAWAADQAERSTENIELVGAGR